MDLRDILSMQNQFDKEHGWDTTNLTNEERLISLEQDLVGLIGEVGEVANIIKKVRLSSRKEQTALPTNLPDVHEELTDIFIYLLRMFQIAGADIEKEYIRKLAKNRERFKKYENGTS